MKAILTFFLVLSAWLHAVPTLHPAAELPTSGLVTDLLVDNGKLYAATYAGTVDIFDIASKKRIGQIALPHIKDFMGDDIPAKIYSIDKFGDRIMMVSEGKSGYRNVFLYEHGKLSQIIDAHDYLPIKKGLLLDHDHLLFGLLSSEIILYDIAKKTKLYRKTIDNDISGGSAFDDMVLDETRTTLATSDESGDVNIFDARTFRHEKLLSGQNVDNVYKIDYKQGTVITAGKDRRCAVYPAKGRPYYIKSSFIVFAAALSPSARHGFFSADADNDIEMFDTQSREKLAMLKGHNATISDFAFVDETHLFSSAEEKRILYWDLSTLH